MHVLYYLCGSTPFLIVFCKKNTQINCKIEKKTLLQLVHGFGAEIVEITFVVSRFSDIQKETTLFLVVPKKTDQERSLFSVGSDNYTTRNDQE